MDPFVFTSFDLFGHVNYLLPDNDYIRLVVRKKSSGPVFSYWLSTLLGGNNRRDATWRFHGETCLEVLSSRCFAAAQNKSYLCPASQRALRHHWGEKWSIYTLHVFMRHHHICRRVYSVTITTEELNTRFVKFNLICLVKNPRHLRK